MTQLIRVLVVVTAREVGGAERYVLHLARALMSVTSTIQITVLLPSHKAMDSFAREIQPFARAIRAPLDLAAQLPRLSYVLRNLAISHDVIHLNSNHPCSRLGIWAGFVLQHSNRPFITVEQRVSEPEDIALPLILRATLPTLFRYSRKRAQRIVAVSQENAQRLVTRYRIPLHQIQVIYNSIPSLSLDQETIQRARAEVRDELGLKGDQPIVLCVARLSPNKGQHVLAAAATEVLRHFPEAHFALAGDGEDREAIQQLTQQLGIAHAFSLLGLRHDIPRLLAASDWFVLPSLAEGFSLAILEALSAGLPVIATRVGGAAEVIQEGTNGWLVAPGDPQALATALRHALSLSAEARVVMQQRARESVRDLTVERMAQQMLHVYQDAIRSFSIKADAKV